jgi:hypothetical protein
MQTNLQTLTDEECKKILSECQETAFKMIRITNTKLNSQLNKKSSISI